MFNDSIRTAILCVSLAAAFSVSAVACGKDKGESAPADKSSDSLALTSPTLCEHAMSLDKALDETRCITRLDGLQIQLGDDDWKPHGTCIAKATSQAEYEAIDDWQIVPYAESLGYDSAWVPDSQMIWSDCYATLALAAWHAWSARKSDGAGGAKLLLGCPAEHAPAESRHRSLEDRAGSRTPYRGIHFPPR